jgi:hypothetical protein
MMSVGVAVSPSDGFEVVQHFFVGVVDGAVAFIDDDEIEEVGRELLRLVPDDVEHGGIGRDVDAAVLGDELFADIGPARLMGQVFLEGGQRLFAQGDAVDEKQRFFGMTGTHQGIDHGDAGAGLAGAGGHDQQEVAFFLFDAFQDGADGPDLVVTACDGVLISSRFGRSVSVYGIPRPI